jgi:uncharacterized protein (TIGR00730 family)
MNRKTITIFGSSLPLPGQPEYEDAYLIGKKLAGHGFNICSGGSQGIMDAVSKGAVEENREAIGITVEIFNTHTSKNLTREVKCNTLFQRLDNLINYGDGFIILPGGTGTLLEISLLWEMFNKNLVKDKPAAAYGQMWEKIVNTMEERVKFEQRRVNLIKCFNKSEDIVEYMVSSLK